MLKRCFNTLLIICLCAGLSSVATSIEALAVKPISPQKNEQLPQLAPSKEDLSPLRVGLYHSFLLTHQQQLETVYQTAITTVERAKSVGETIGWVVLDLDETVLDNRAYFIAYGDYKPELWKQWLLLGDAPAVAGSLNFISFLRMNQIPFAFLSGRREAQRASTLQNLMRLGLPTTVPILMKPDIYTEGKTAIEFKQTHRCGLEAQSGVKVWMLIGDQASDLRGDCRGTYQFKLPNPIYTVE